MANIPYHSVAVIGAGLSGLYAACQLANACPDVVVLEAHDYVGGRVKQVHGLAPWPMEGGPEFVHGATSTFVEVASEAGVTFSERAWPDYWWFGAERRLVADEHVGGEVDKVHDLFDGCGDAEPPPPGADISAAQWMREQGASATMMAVADACYANDFCCSLEELGLREMIEENRRWDSGETYLIMDQSMGTVVSHLAKRLDVRTRWPVSNIDCAATPQCAPGGADRGASVLLTCADGRQLRCGKAVVTVPLKVLQDSCISFNPPLPSPKLAALSRVRMGHVVKLLLSFHERFWPEGMFDVVCTDCPVPEFWMLSRAEVLDRTSEPSSAAPLAQAHPDPSMCSILQGGSNSAGWRGASAAVPHPMLNLHAVESSQGCWRVASGCTSGSGGCVSSGTGEAAAAAAAAAAGGASREGVGAGCYTVTGFAAGKRGAALSALSPVDAVLCFLDQLDSIFGAGTTSAAPAAAAAEAGSGTAASESRSAASLAAVGLADAVAQRNSVGATSANLAATSAGAIQKASTHATLADGHPQAHASSALPSCGRRRGWPARAAFAAAEVVNWSCDPYVRGGYSHPSLGAESGDRQLLAEPVGGLLFFAGEATHTGLNPCVQGALETGRRAAAEVLAAQR